MTMKGPEKAGRLRGQAGFTLIDMLFVVALIGLLSTLAIPGMMRARGAAQASSALGTMRVVNSGQLSFAITCGLGFYAQDFPTLGIKPPGATDAFLTQELVGGVTVVKAGYNFSMAGIPMAGSPGTCNGIGPGATASAYAAVADPVAAAATGRFFGTNADGLIYEHSATLSGVMPESGAPPVGALIK